MKKGLTLLMTLALVLAMAVGALAAEDWVTPVQNIENGTKRLISSSSVMVLPARLLPLKPMTSTRMRRFSFLRRCR